MSIPVLNIEAKIVEPADLRISRRGGFASLIIDVGTKVPDHWFANIYPESGGGDYLDCHFGDLQPLFEANRGVRFVFSGLVRRWTMQSEGRSGNAVTIDIKTATLK